MDFPTKHRQMGLFEAPSLNIQFDLKCALSTSAKRSGLSREEILDKLNEMALRYGVRLVKGNGKKLTMATLDKWLNTSDQTRNMPSGVIPLFCVVTQNMAPLQVMAVAMGGQVIDDEDRRLLEWAKAYRNAQKAKAHLKSLEAKLS
jgi:hypothetical protein